MNTNFMKEKMLPVILISSSLIVAGCSSGHGKITPHNIKNLTQDAITHSNETPSVIEIIDEPYVNSAPVKSDAWEKFGDVSYKSVGYVNFYDIAKQFADHYNIGLVLDKSLNGRDSDGNRKLDRGISIFFNHLSPVEAIKKISQAAGYYAAYNPAENYITIGERAIVTFKLPKIVFTQLGDSGISEEGITEKIKDFVSEDTKINTLEQSGLLVVEGDVHSIATISNFLKKVIASYTSSIDFRAAFLNIRVNNEDSHGIDWQGILKGTSTLKEKQTLSINKSGIQLSVSSKNIEAILTSLKKTNVTKVMSQPHISSSNLQSATINNTTEERFISGTTRTTNAETGAITTDRTQGTAEQGIRLEVTGDILDKKYVQVRVKPTIKSLAGRVEIETSDGQTSQIPRNNTIETESQLTVSSGDTIILGGLRATDDEETITNVLDGPWTNLFKPLFEKGSKTNQTNEIWILLNVTIREHPVSDPLISEVIYSQ